MYSYGGSLYKKNGSLKSQLNRKPQQKLPLTEETCFAGLKNFKREYPANNGKRTIEW